MEMIAAVGGLGKMRWILRVPRSGVQINDGVEVSAGTNPVIHFLPIDFAIRSVVLRSFIGENCRPIYTNVMSMCSVNDLLVSGNQIVRRCCLFITFLGRNPSSEIVHSLQHNQPTHAILSEDITIEKGQRGLRRAS